MFSIFNCKYLLYSLVMLLFYFADSSTWSVQTSGLDSNLRGISISKEGNSVWASGSNGVILRSTDDGKTWKRLTVADGSDLDFRDIEAFGPNLAYVMSSGDGDKSRIYKTTDGGINWKLQYSDKRPGFFLDSLACDSSTHCVALSDPVDGKFLLLSMNDGEHWTELPRDNMPAALPQEGAFAASGTAIALCDSKIFFATGGPAARIFRTSDQSRAWTVAQTPIASGNASSGIFSIACADHDILVAVGGDYKDPNRAKQVAAYSKNSGKTWQLSQTQPGGYRSAIAAISDGDFVVVGPTGSDVSHDQGVHWQHADSSNLNAISFRNAGGWAVGPKETISRFNAK